MIKSELDDYGFQERWLVIDLILKKDRPDLGDHSIQFCRPDRPMTYCRGPGNRRRWEITLLDTEDENRVTKPDHIWSLLKPWITSDEASLERTAVYTFKSQVARNWRHGRIFLAGDAAHVTPPFLGQGMCMGIRDAFNLAWKLASVINKDAEHPLLDSYEDERNPHARAYVEMAIKIGQIIRSINHNDALKRRLRSSDSVGRNAINHTKTGSKFAHSSAIKLKHRYRGPTRHTVSYPAK